MIKKNIAVFCISAIIITGITGCAGAKRRVKEMNARGTIDAGGYTWRIPADSEGGNTVQTRGLPGRQAATEASNTLCKKYGRIAQYASRDHILLTGLAIFNFNCVR